MQRLWTRDTDYVAKSMQIRLTNFSEHKDEHKHPQPLPDREAELPLQMSGHVRGRIHQCQMDLVICMRLMSCVTGGGHGVPG